MEVSDRTLASFQTWDDVTFVGEFLPDDSSGYERYRWLADRYRDRFTFGIRSRAAQDASLIRCRNGPDDEAHVLTDLWRVEAYASFVRLCAAPLIPELDRKNEEQLNQV